MRAVLGINVSVTGVSRNPEGVMSGTRWCGGGGFATAGVTAIGDRRSAIGYRRSADGGWRLGQRLTTHSLPLVRCRSS